MECLAWTMPFDSLLNLGISNKEGNRCVAIPYVRRLYGSLQLISTCSCRPATYDIGGRTKRLRVVATHAAGGEVFQSNIQGSISSENGICPKERTGFVDFDSEGLLDIMDREKREFRYSY